MGPAENVSALVASEAQHVAFTGVVASAANIVGLNPLNYRHVWIHPTLTDLLVGPFESLTAKDLFGSTRTSD